MKNCLFLVGTVFFGCCSYAVTLFLLLAQRWSKFMILWTTQESVFLKRPYQAIGYKLSTKIKLAAFGVLGLAICKLINYLIYKN